MSKFKSDSVLATIITMYVPLNCQADEVVALCMSYGGYTVLMGDGVWRDRKRIVREGVRVYQVVTKEEVTPTVVEHIGKQVLKRNPKEQEFLATMVNEGATLQITVTRKDKS